MTEREATEIAVRDLEKRYGGVEALSGVDVTLASGRFHCLVGPNGSGKTTLLRTVLGLTRPSAGAVDVPDVALGCAFQRPSFYPDLTVAENLSTFGSFVGADEGWIGEVVDRLGLDVVRDRMAGELSGGYARKLDLALALAKRPEFLLLDEPLGDLDDVTQRRLVSFLAEYRDLGAGVVVSTHNLEAFEAHADHLTVLAGGEVLFDGPAEAVDGDLHPFYVEQVLAPE